MPPGAQAADQTLEIVIRLRATVPFLVVKGNEREVARTVTDLLVQQVSDALGELKRSYDVEVLGKEA